MFRKRHAPVGARPGTLVISPDSPEPQFRIIQYTSKVIREYSISSQDIINKQGDYSTLVEDLGDQNAVTWVDVQGLGNEKALKGMADLVGLHFLTLADVVNIPQRPKTELHDDYVVYIGSMVHHSDKSEIELEQLGVIWSKSFVITFQELLGDVLDPVRDRLRKAKGPIRKSGTDYLAYAIIDTTIDALFPIFETIGERLEELEEQIVASPTEDSLRMVYHIKRELLKLRRSVWPQREAISALARDENKFVCKTTRVFMRDTYEHIIQIIDVLETYRELAGSFMDVYLSSLSNKMNEVMKVLTIIGTIFIPLSFLAGVFGMNFEHMPELKWKYAYPAFWVVILSIAGVLLWFFRKNGWIGKSTSLERPKDS
jgi:magnesium transporter